MSSTLRHKLMTTTLLATSLLMAAPAYADDGPSWWDPLGLFSDGGLPTPPAPGDLPGIKGLPGVDELPAPPAPDDLPKPGHGWLDPLGLFGDSGDDREHADAREHRHARGDAHDDDDRHEHHRGRGHRHHHDDD